MDSLLAYPNSWSSSLSDSLKRASKPGAMDSRDWFDFPVLTK